MEVIVKNSGNRVRERTPNKVNEKIDRKTLDRIRQYRELPKEEIDARIETLRTEWGMERSLEVNASTMALTGVLLGALVNRKWYLLSGLAAGFLLQYGLQGWCPPVPLFRAFKVRTRREIDEEIYAMKEVRGDFNDLSPESSSVELLAAFRK